MVNEEQGEKLSQHSKTALFEGPEFAELRLRAIADDILKIVDRLERFPVSGSLLAQHPIYGRGDEQLYGYPLLQEVATEIAEFDIIPHWDPNKKLTFPQWWSAFGYPMLREAVGREVVRTDINLHGMWDPRKRKFRVSEAVAFTVDPESTAAYGANAYTPSATKLPPASKRLRLARYEVWLADEITDRNWRKILQDDEAELIIDFIESWGNVSLAALNWGLSESGCRRKITRICTKAHKAIKAAIDERLNLSDVPDWDVATMRLAAQRVEDQIVSSNYARRSYRQKPSEIDSIPNWREYAKRASDEELLLPKDRIEWGKRHMERISENRRSK